MDSIIFVNRYDFSALSPQQIITDLSKLKDSVNQQVYSICSTDGRNKIMDFIFLKIPEIWESENLQIKYAAASAYGYFLLRLAPFFARKLFSRLIKDIKSLEKGNLLHVAGLCYLSKFYYPMELHTILSTQHFLHLFSNDSLDKLPTIVAHLLDLPIDILKSLADLFVSQFLSSHDDRYLPKAISLITEVEPQSFAYLITEDMEPHNIGRFFSKAMPKIDKNIAEKHTNSLVEMILDKNTCPNKYEAACFSLHLLIESNQAEPSCIENKITLDIINQSQSLPSLLLLPIPTYVISSLYSYEPPSCCCLLPSVGEEVGSSPSQNGDIKRNKSLTPLSPLIPVEPIQVDNNGEEPLDEEAALDENSLATVKSPKTLNFGKFKADKKYILPLMGYFSNNLFFTKELVSLIGMSLDPYSMEYSEALRYLGLVCRKIPSNDLNDLLLKAFSIEPTNWIQSLWTLKLIAQLDFTLMQQNMIQRAFDLIEDASVSQGQKLQETAKETIMSIRTTMPFEQFIIFIDHYTRRLDVFNSNDFELRISFLSYIFYNIPGSWMLPFLHVWNLIVESISIFKFTPQMLEGVFTIMAVFGANMKDPENTLVFVNHAVGVIQRQYTLFSGQALSFPRSPLMTSIIPHDEITLKKIESDISVTPDASYREILSTSEKAFLFLSKIQWREMKMHYEDLHFLLYIATEMSPLFTKDSLHLAIALFECRGIPKDPTIHYLKKVLHFITREDEMLYYISAFELATQKFTISHKDFKVEKIVAFTKNFIQTKRDIEFVTLIRVRKFLHEFGLDLTDEQCEDMIVDSQKHFLHESMKDIIKNIEAAKINHKIRRESETDTSETTESSDKLDSSEKSIEEQIPINLPIINEHPDSLDRIKLSDIRVRPYNDDVLNATRFNSTGEGLLNLGSSFPSTDSFFSYNSSVSRFTLSTESFEDENSDFLKNIPTLTPLLATKLDIPDEIFNMPLINSALTHSRAKISKEMAFKMLEKALNHKNSRVVNNCLRFLVFNKYYYPIEKLLQNKIFENRRYFTGILAMLGMKYSSFEELPEYAKKYILSVLINPKASVAAAANTCALNCSMDTDDEQSESTSSIMQSITHTSSASMQMYKVTTMEDIPQFVLYNISNPYLKRICTNLVKFDPAVFSEYLLKLPSIKKEQTYNLFFILPYIKFKLPQVINHIFDLTKNSKKKFLMTIRLLTILLQKESSMSSSTSSQALDKQIQEEMSSPKTMAKSQSKEKDETPKTQTPDSPGKSIKSSTPPPNSLKTTPLGEVARKILQEYHTKAQQNNALMIEICYLSITYNKVCHKIPKLSTKIYNFIGKQSYLGSALYLIAQNTASDYESVSNLALPSAALQSYISLRHHFIKDHPESSLPFSSALDHIIKTKRKKNPIMTKEICALVHSFFMTKPSKQICTQIFNSWLQIVDTNPTSADFVMLIPPFKSAISIFHKKMQEHHIVTNLLHSTFEYQVLPPGTVDALLLASVRLKDPELALTNFPSFLKVQTCYPSYLYAESIALFSYKFNNKKDAKDVACYVPLCNSFFASFYATVSLEKKVNLSNDILATCYSPANAKALTMLHDQYLRPFAIYYAFLPPSEDTPRDLDDFVQEMAEELKTRESEL